MSGEWAGVRPVPILAEVGGVETRAMIALRPLPGWLPTTAFDRCGTSTLRFGLIFLRFRRLHFISRWRPDKISD